LGGSEFVFEVCVSLAWEKRQRQTRLIVKKVGCGYCQCQAGVSCRGRYGKRIKTIHADRRRAYKALMKLRRQKKFKRNSPKQEIPQEATQHEISQA